MTQLKKGTIYHISSTKYRAPASQFDFDSDKFNLYTLSDVIEDSATYINMKCM